MKGQTLGAFIKLTIFAVVTILATIVLGIVISNRTLGGSPKTYHAVFSDVTDLLTGNDVRLAGVRVGTVKSIDVVPVSVNGSVVDQAEVSFTVNGDVPIFDTTKVQVHYLNLVGQRYIDVEEQAGEGTSQPPDSVIGCATPAVSDPSTTKPLCSRDKAAESRTSPAVDLTALFNGFKPLFQALTPADVNNFSLEIVKTLQGEGGTVDSLLTQTASLTKTVANRDAVIGQVVDNLLTVLNTVRQRNAGLDETITQLQRLVTGLAGDRNTIAASLHNIDNLATNSTRLISGVRPYLPKDLTALTKLAHNLNTAKNSNGKNALTDELNTLPAKLNRIIRTATYGGYFNFWMCELDVANLPFRVAPINPATAPSCPAVS